MSSSTPSSAASSTVVEYEKWRNTILQYYKAVRHTQQGIGDDVMRLFPVLQMGSGALSSLVSLPLPNE